MKRHWYAGKNGRRENFGHEPRSELAGTTATKTESVDTEIETLRLDECSRAWKFEIQETHERPN
jgi:hypothetical protein